MSATKFFILALTVFLALSGCCRPDEEPNSDILFQVSTINALLEGVYDGEVTFGELRDHGDFGIGTFNALDGEMIGIDNQFYQIKAADGKAYPVLDGMKTPFANVTFFEPDKSLSLDGPMNYADLKTYIDDVIESKNLFYAIRIEGDFKYLKTRVVPAQTKPYPRLIEAVKHQPTFEFHNVKGTIAGFRLPEYVNGINFPLYHLHFIDDERTAGGHLLECDLSHATIKIDVTAAFFMLLPQKGGFHQAELAKDKLDELKKVEE